MTPEVAGSNATCYAQSWMELAATINCIKGLEYFLQYFVLADIPVSQTQQNDGHVGGPVGVQLF